MPEIEDAKLNWKDKKIIERLDINSRSPNSKIGRKVGFSSQIVNYRILRLEERGIIKGFYTLVNVKKLGYTNYEVLFNTKYLNSKAMAKIVLEVKKIPEISWFVSCRGEWNIISSIMTKNVEEFSYILEKLIDIIGNYLIRHDLFIIIRQNMLPYRKLIGKEQSIEDEKSVGYKNSVMNIEITKTDKTILRNIVSDARVGKKELSIKTGLSVDKIRYSLEKLEKNGIIKSYKPSIDVTKIGMAWHIVFFRLNPGEKSRKEELVNYLKGRFSAFRIVQGVGTWSLMTEFHSNDLNDFNLLYDKLLLRYEDIISEISVTQVLEEHINRYLPANY